VASGGKDLLSNFLKAADAARQKELEEFSDLAKECGFKMLTNESADEFAAPFLQRRAEQEIDSLANRTEEAFNKCESPIEKALLGAVLFRALKEHQVESFDFSSLAGPEEYRWLRTPDSPCELMVGPQFKIEKYRVDFLFVAREYAGSENDKPIFSKKFVVVECDGHDFHERTKEQAARDRSKDRAIQKLGYPILRFTGSEIYRDPIKCADEVVDLLLQKEAGRG